MPDELTPEQKFAAQDLADRVPLELARGRTRDELIEELVRLDWSPAAAAALVDRAAAELARYRASPESRHLLVREAFRQFVGGLVMVAIGACIGASTLLLWLAGSPVIVFPAGIMLVMVLIGLVLTSRGFSRWRVYRRDDVFPR